MGGDHGVDEDATSDFELLPGGAGVRGDLGVHRDVVVAVIGGDRGGDLHVIRAAAVHGDRGGSLDVAVSATGGDHGVNEDASSDFERSENASGVLDDLRAHFDVALAAVRSDLIGHFDSRAHFDVATASVVR